MFLNKIQAANETMKPLQEAHKKILDAASQLNLSVQKDNSFILNAEYYTRNIVYPLKNNKGMLTHVTLKQKTGGRGWLITVDDFKLPLDCKQLTLQKKIEESLKIRQQKKMEEESEEQFEKEIEECLKGLPIEWDWASVTKHTITLKIPNLTLEQVKKIVPKIGKI